MILFSQTGWKPRLPISYIMRNQREKVRRQNLLGLEICLEYNKLVTNPCNERNSYIKYTVSITDLNS